MHELMVAPSRPPEPEWKRHARAFATAPRDRKFGAAKTASTRLSRSAMRVMFAAAGFAWPLAAHACATCGCSLSADAAMGYSAAAGWRASLQYDYIDQNQLRRGSGTASPARVVNDPTTGELEHRTLSRYLIAGIDYSPNADWNLSLRIPYVVRDHSSYTDTSSAPFFAAQLDTANLSNARSASLGDVRLIASYQGFLPIHNLGVQLGVKLPTGHYGGPDAAGTGAVGDHPVSFSAGPSAGQPLDASLQPGTGSTDLIVGAYYFQAISQDFDAFVNGQFQAAIAEKLNHAGEDFRPGNFGVLSFGLRYEANPKILPQLQMNLSHKSRDQGALADVQDSAGSVVYLSPGITVSLRQNVQLYGFVQLPVYSRLDGYQLFPHWSASVGVSYAY